MPAMYLIFLFFQGGFGVRSASEHSSTIVATRFPESVLIRSSVARPWSSIAS